MKKKIHIDVEEKLKIQLQQEAKQKGLSLNSYIRIILLERKK